LLAIQKNEAGEDQLSSLKEKNVGAIYLSNIGTQFDIKNSDNQELRMVTIIDGKTLIFDQVK